MKVNPKQVRALMNLLADDDRSIALTAEEKLLEMGSDVLPELKQHLPDQPLPVKLRVREIVYRIEADDLKETFRNLPTTSSGEPELLPALFAVARIDQPTLPSEPYERELDRFAAEVERELEWRNAVAPRSVVETVSEVLFDRLGFEGNREDYYNPANSYLHRVIRDRRGIPLTLSALVLVIANRLDLPFQGVGMPAHFILRFPTPGEPIFLDPFNGGRLLSRRDCIDFLEQAGFQFVPEFLEPVDNKALLQRALRNLAKVFSHNEMPERINEIQAYLAIVTKQY